MSKAKRQLALFIAVIVLVIALVLSRMTFNSTSADAARQLDARGTQIVETQKAP